MSRETVELFRRNMDDWSRGDRESWLSVIPADWEYHTSGVFPGLKPVYRGPEGAAELWDAMREPWERFEINLQRIEDLGERIVALVTFKVVGRDGLETGRRWGYVSTFRDDGTPVRTDNFETWDEALAAVGLSH
jgi:ketosteroid isomerase-like protein